MNIPKEISGSKFAARMSRTPTQAIQNYLRVSRSGGMPKTLSDKIEAAVEDAERLGYFA